MKTTPKPIATACLAALLSLGACGGGSGDFKALIGGEVNGLAAGQNVVLENNGGDSLTVSSNGRFNFRGQLLLDERYLVTIRTQPSAQVCQLSDGAGRVNLRSEDVTSVRVVCVKLT